jgi:serine/threonine protein phosphatase PrpC
MLAISIADGHGDKRGGAVYAKEAITTGLPLIQAESERILGVATGPNAEEETQQAMNEILTKLDKMIVRRNYFECGMSPMGGGSTLTVQILFAHPETPEKLVSLVSNLGDSPLMTIGSDGLVTEKTFCLNADTLHAYQYYLDTVPVDQAPEEVYLGRFNMTTWGSYKVPCFGLPDTDEDGIEINAIRPFSLKQHDGRWVASVNNDTMKKVFTKCPKGMFGQIETGGIQTRRDCESFLKAKNLAEIGLADYPTWNFGNTNCNGTIQCLRGSGIGDIEHKIPADWEGRPWEWILRGPYPDILSKTSVSIVDPSEILVMGSDGFFDIMTDAALFEVTEEQIPVTEMVGSLSKKMYSESLLDSRFEKCYTPDGSQCWDDISIWVIKATTTLPDPEPEVDEDEGKPLWCLYPQCHHTEPFFSSKDLRTHVEMYH